jgi:hypothetical protein
MERMGSAPFASLLGLPSSRLPTDHLSLVSLLNNQQQIHHLQQLQQQRQSPFSSHALLELIQRQQAQEELVRLLAALRGEQQS